MTDAPQIANRTLFTGDNLAVMRAMNSESVDLIYLDPPFNKKFVFPIGTAKEKTGIGFTDIWGFGKHNRVEQGNIPGMQEAELRAYSEIEEASALFVNRQAVISQSDSKHLLAFLELSGKIADPSAAAYLSFMAVRLLEMKRILKPTGSIYLHCDHTIGHSIKLLMDIIFGTENFRNELIWHYGGTGNQKTRFPAKHDTIFFYAKGKNRFWQVRIPAKKISGWTGKDTKLCDSVWNINTAFNSAQRNFLSGYPTEKPLPLVERVILASSKEKDLVLDPFCGCATTCIAAERLNRSWIGIDVSPEAVRQVKIRLNGETEQGTLAEGQRPVFPRDFNDPSQRPMRTDIVLTRSRNIKQTLYGLQNGDCNLCRGHFEIQMLEVDHIAPKAHGGLDIDANLQLLCPSCNRIKGAGTMQRARDRLRQLGYVVDKAA